MMMDVEIANVSTNSRMDLRFHDCFTAFLVLFHFFKRVVNLKDPTFEIANVTEENCLHHSVYAVWYISIYTN